MAGYCWDWNSKKNASSYDIIFNEFDFKMRWNLANYGSLWLIDPNSVSEIGCIHTLPGTGTRVCWSNYWTRSNCKKWQGYY